MLIYNRNDNSNQLTNDGFKYELAYRDSVSVLNIQYQCSTQNGLDMERDWAFLNRQTVADGSLLLQSPFRANDTRTSAGWNAQSFG